MINATQMAKAYCKKVNDFTRLAKTKEFIQLLEKHEKQNQRSRYGKSRIVNNSATVESKGGFLAPRNGKSRFEDGEALEKVMTKRKVGRVYQTWFCYQLALDFAAWLSPEFKLWVYGKILDLIQNGVATLEENTEPTNQLQVATFKHQMKIYKELEILFNSVNAYTIGNSVRTHAELVETFGANRGFYTNAKLPSTDTAKVVVRQLLNVELAMKSAKDDTLFQNLLNGGGFSTQLILGGQIG